MLLSTRTETLDELRSPPGPGDQDAAAPEDAFDAEPELDDPELEEPSEEDEPEDSDLDDDPVSDDRGFAAVSDLPETPDFSGGFDEELRLSVL